MPEYGSVKEMPEFLEAYTNSQIALANAGADEAAQLRAKLHWAETEKDLEVRRQKHNEAIRIVETGKESVKAKYPNVPEHIYAGQTDPVAMESIAKQFEDAVKAATTPQQPPGTPPTAASMGQPPTGVQGAAPPLTDWQARERELAEKINAGTAKHREVEEYQNIRINMRMVPSMQRAREEARRS